MMITRIVLVMCVRCQFYLFFFSSILCRNLQSRWEKQRVESERLGCGEYRRRICCAAVRTCVCHSGRDSRVLLELEEECSVRSTIALLGDGRGTQIRCQVSWISSTSRPEAQLRKMQPWGAYLRPIIFRPATSLRGNFSFLSIQCECSCFMLASAIFHHFTRSLSFITFLPFFYPSFQHFFFHALAARNSISKRFPTHDGTEKIWGW